MNQCPKCKAPARHMSPDGDFRYDPPTRRPSLSGWERELIANIVIPAISERSREPKDAWDQAADVLRSLL